MIKYKYIKRVLDVLLSILGLLVLFPLLVIVTVLLLVVNNGSPFFFQKRPGRHEKIFSIIKFKTMNDDTDANGQLLPETKRLTAIGKIIRKLSIDELPQLINVLKGDMSFIGPRPLLPRYLEYYTEREKKRHTVRPGITGLAQVSGRNFLDWDTRLAKDVAYVETMSLKNDLLIIIKTIKNVISAKDIAINPLEDLDISRKNKKII